MIGSGKKKRPDHLAREIRAVIIAVIVLAVIAGIFLALRVRLRRGLATPDELYAEAIECQDRGQLDVARDELLLAIRLITEDIDIDSFDEHYVRDELKIPPGHKLAIIDLDIDKDDKDEVLLSIGYPYNLFAVDFGEVERGRERVSFVGFLESWYDIDIRDLDHDTSAELIVASGEPSGFLSGYRVFRWLQGRYVRIASIGYAEQDERLKDVSAYYRDIDGDGIDEIKLVHFATYITPSGRVREKGDFIILAWDGFAYSPLEGDEAKVAVERFSFMSGIVGTGTVRYLDFEGGSYGIISDDGKRYDPVDLPDGFKNDGLRVSFFVEPVPDEGFNSWGSVVKVVDIDVL